MSEEFYSEIEDPFTRLPVALWEIGLTGNEMIVLHRIIFRAGFRGQCFESRKSIAKACCMSDRTVSAVFDELERINIIQIIRRQLEGKPNLIRVKQPAAWISKRKNLPKQQEGSEIISHRGRKPFPTGYENFSHRTRSNELDQIELDLIKEIDERKIIASAEAAAPQEAIEPEVIIDEPKSKSQKSSGALIFEAYREAYIRRYNVEPLRNAKTNSICSQISKQLPLDEAIALIHFFLQQNVAFYIQRGHAIQLALGDLQALRTNMLNNQAMSSRQAQLADKQQAQKNALQNYLENREKYALK